MHFVLPKHRWVRLACFAILLGLALIFLTPLETTFADEPNGIDVIVTNKGKSFHAEPANTTVSAPFAGSGPVARTFSESNGPEPLTGQVMQYDHSAESVIYPDGRTRVGKTTKYPNSAIANIVMTFPDGNYICTAWFTGPNTLATAGHCVFDPVTLQFASRILVYPGRDGSDLPYGQAKAKELFTNDCWIKTQDPKCDYGGIRINKDLGNQTGWLGFGYKPDKNKLLNRKVNVRGYPGDKGGTSLWTMKGPIEVTTNKQVGYSIDTAGGQSGSPAFSNYLCKRCAIAIHAYGFNQFNPSPPFGARNSGTRITKGVFNALCAWRGGC